MPLGASVSACTGWHSDVALFLFFFFFVVGELLITRLKETTSVHT